MTAARPRAPLARRAGGAAERIRALFPRRLAMRLPQPFPEAAGNAFEPIEQGVRFYERMVASIDSARAAVDVEMYLWHDDEVGRHFVDALVRAARRGLRVRVLVDAQGSGSIAGRLAAVTDAGADVRLFNPFRLRFWRRYLTRTHRKLLLLDGASGFTGGAGFSLHFSGRKGGEHPWFDRMFEVRGPVVTQLETAFEASFRRWKPSCAPCEGPDATEPVLAPPGRSGATTLRVLRGWPDPRDFGAVFLRSIRESRERVWIGTPYFLPPRRVRHALYAAAARGVDVRVIVPSLPHANAVLYHALRARYGRYLRQGVKLFEYRDAFYHAKTFVADRAVAIVGSSNLDSWSWRRNAELDLAVTDAATVERVAALLADDRARSHEVTLDEARVRDFLASAKQSFASWIEDWL